MRHLWRYQWVFVTRPYLGIVLPVTRGGYLTRPFFYPDNVFHY